MLNATSADCSDRRSGGHEKGDLGQICGHVRKHSDTLLIFLLKARRPEKYRERIEHQHGGHIAVKWLPPQTPKKGPKTGQFCCCIGTTRWGPSVLRPWCV